MDTYEVHVPCGKKVIVVCKEKGEDVVLLKNGESVFNENKKKNTVNLPDVNNTEKEEEEQEEEQEEEENRGNNSSPTSENMAGGKKSRRNASRKSRKNQATRKNQAGGKRAPNAYMKFASKMRPQILKEHPELKSDVVAVARKIGEKWRALSDSEKKKF